MHSDYKQCNASYTSPNSGCLAPVLIPTCVRHCPALPCAVGLEHGSREEQWQQEQQKTWTKKGLGQVAKPHAGAGTWDLGTCTCVCTLALPHSSTNLSFSQRRVPKAPVPSGVPERLLPGNVFPGRSRSNTLRESCLLGVV